MKSMVNGNKKNIPLYQTSSGKIFVSDILRALDKVGVKRGDTLFIHSDVSVFGKLACEGLGLFFGAIIVALKKSVGGEGTIIMPTFTYSFSRNQIFDVENSPSTVGVLTEYFRKKRDVTRTVEPMFSVAIWGNKKETLSKVGNDCFGKDSIFHKLHERKGKILCFGSRACTFFHYIERMHGVPYRFEKKFKGKIKDGKKIYQDEFIHYARRLGRKSTSHFSIALGDLLKKRLANKIALGHSKIVLVRSDVLYKEVFDRLNRDTNYYLKSSLNEKEESRLT